ncbi:class I SAM-dependent methyltransferase [Pseudidiomarina sp.]|uniref:class I SAM-dependent methyltransferase n=1 Tax=Pseudidiomarina sp. TaxID=2081707 RepID=UPI003A97F486
MTKSYTEHFKERGTAYECAMRQFPHARDEEFEQLIHAAQLESGVCVADVPAGGGYLKRYLPNDAIWLGHEPCESFTNHATSNGGSVPLLPLPWHDASIDCTMSLAGVHHLFDKKPLFDEFARILKPEGKLILSDVEEHSPVAQFLDEFVGAYNSTGHEGIYLNRSTPDEIAQAGFEITSSERVNLVWRLPTKQELAVFCKQLFDLKRANDDQVAQAIEHYLGFVSLADNQIGMNWQLTTITAQRK